MSDITLRTKDYLGIAKAIDTNKNNIIDENEAKTSIKGKVTVNQLASSLEKNIVVINDISLESSANVASYLSDKFNKSISINKDNNKILKFVDDNFDLELSKEEISNSLNNGTISISKNITINNQKTDKLEQKFGKEDSEIINKFRKTDSFPRANEYKSNLIHAVIKNTSSINDMESSTMFNKENYSIAAGILEITQMKNNPELKNSVVEFMKKIPENNKMSLVAVDNLFKREPKISDEDLKKIFDKLNIMSNEKYDNDIGNSIDLTMSALHDVSMPTNISQESIGTCAGTSIQIQLALRNPIEYLNMLDTLSKRQNYMSLNGKEIQPNFTFVQEGINDNKDTERTISSKIMQNAIMDYSDSDERNYDSSKGDDGLNRYQTMKSLKDIININVESNDMLKMTPRQIIQCLKNSKPDWSNPIELGMSYSSSGRDSRHSVNVINISDNDVTIINPWGRTETFPTQDLEQRIIYVNNLVSTSTVDRKLDIKSPEIIKELEKENPNKDVLSKIALDKMYTFIKNVAIEPDSNKKLTDSEKIVILNLMNEVLNLSEEQAQDQAPYTQDIMLNQISLMKNLELDIPLYKEVKLKIDFLNYINEKPIGIEA